MKLNPKVLRISIPAAVLAAGALLGGCQQKVDDNKPLDLPAEQRNSQPLDDGNPPPGQINPSSGQPTGNSQPGKVGLPGNKAGK